MDEMQKIYSYSEIGEIDENKAEIQIVPVGEWDHKKYGKVTITDEDCVAAVEEFNAGERTEIQMNYDHKEGKASGWMKKLIHRAGIGIFAVAKYTDKAIEMIKSGEYKYISPEIFTNWKAKTGDRSWRLRIGGAALTNRPFFEGMQPITEFAEPTLTLMFAEDVEDVQRKELDNIDVSTNVNNEMEKTKMKFTEIKKALKLEGEVTEEVLMEKFTEMNQDRKSVV